MGVVIPRAATILAVLAAISLYGVAPASVAQTLPGQESSRGVRILEPETNDTPPTPPAPPALKPVYVAPMPIPPIHFCDRPFAHTDVTLGAPGPFGRELFHKLREGHRVVVNLTTPYPDKGAPPGTLSPWLAAVQAGGGTVTVREYCEAARGALSSWLAQLFRPKAGDLYWPAKRYDVVLHADALDRVVTQVEFTPKAARRGS